MPTLRARHLEGCCIGLHSTPQAYTLHSCQAPVFLRCLECSQTEEYYSHRLNRAEIAVQCCFLLLFPAQNHNKPAKTCKQKLTGTANCHTITNGSSVFHSHTHSRDLPSGEGHANFLAILDTQARCLAKGTIPLSSRRPPCLTAPASGIVIYFFHPLCPLPTLSPFHVVVVRSM